MIRASIHFRKESGPTVGWSVLFEALPRIGEEIRLLDADGADEQYGIVAAVVHTMSAAGEYQAGAQMIEVFVDAWGE